MTHFTAADKIKLAIDWVAKIEPIAVPTVLTRWRINEDKKCPTMSTDGRSLNYNPSFVEKLSLAATKAILLHEVGHVLSNHQHRRGARNPKGYNIAADLALNCLLIKGYRMAFDGSDIKLHDELVTSKVSGGCFVGFGPFAGLPYNKSAEEYYELLKAQNPPPPPQPPPGDGPCEEGEPGEATGGQRTRRVKDRRPDADDEDDDGVHDFDDSDCDPLSGDSDDSDESSDESSGEGNETSDSGDEDDSSDSGSTSIDGRDFQDESSEDSKSRAPGSEPGVNEGDDSEDGDAVPLNTGKDEDHDPFANLPDPAETFGGGIEDAPLESELREDEANIILEALLGGDSYGPSGLGEIISQYKKGIEGDPEVAASINWRRELEKFLRVQHAAGWKYDRPSRRHSHRSDVVLPARRARSKTRGLFIVDTSGSMGDQECNQALDHLGKILSIFPLSTVTLVQCDTGVRASREYRSSDFPIREFSGWAGRGGTDLDPAFRWAKSNRSTYDWIVVVSDMEWAWYRATDPGIPTLWINTRRHIPWGYGSRGGRMPFGKLVNFHAVQNQ